MNKIAIPKFVLILLGFLLLTACVAIGLLFFNDEQCAVEENKTGQNTEEVEDVNDKCVDIDLKDTSGAWRYLEKIEKIANDTSYGVVITVTEVDENGSKTGECKLYITDYVEEGLGVSNTQLGALSEIVYIGEGSVAYNYGNAIYTQKIEEDAKAVVIANQELAAETSLEEEGETLIFDGPFLVDKGEKTGVSETGQFVFLVDFIFGCETDTLPRSCEEMTSLSQELEEQGVTGWWMYKGLPGGGIVHLIED